MRSIALLLMLAPSLAFARSARPLPRSPAPPAPISVENGRVENRSLSIDCQPTASDASFCTLVFELDVVADSEGEAIAALPLSLGPDQLEVARERERGPSDREVLAPGERMHVRVRAHRRLSLEEPDHDELVMADALFARHLLLAPRSPTLPARPARIPLGVDWLLLQEGVRVEGELATAVHVPEDVEVSIEGSLVRVHPRPDVVETPLLRHGGPFVAFGEQFRYEPDQTRYLGRVGYEVGIHDWVIGSVAFESDFETRFTSSMTIELASPPFLALILALPGLSGGVGAVWDVSERGHRFAMRLTAGMSALVVGALATFDFYPSDGEWVVSETLRASL